MDCAFAISGYCFACFEFRAEGALKPVWFRLVRVMVTRTKTATCPSYLLLAGAVGGASLTSLNTTGTGRFEVRFVFASHQLRVASGIPCCRENPARVRPLRLNCSTICSRSAAFA